MLSTPKHRPKPGFKSPKSKPKPEPEPESSSSSRTSAMQPPESLFPSKGEFLRLVLVLAIASSVAFTCNFMINYFNPIAKPFCDTNVDSLDSLPDTCQPCPRNGECNRGNLECDHGFQKHGNLCIEDGDINERAKKLSQWIESRLCEAYAQFLCNGVGLIWVQEDDIWNDLSGHQLMENFESDNPIYLFTKRSAMEIITKLLETRTNSQGKKELKCPDLRAGHYKPFTCRIREWIFQHFLVIAPVCAVVIGFIWLLWKVRRRWYLSIRGEELYNQICEMLEENAMMSKRGNDECEPWVVASKLRDHLLSPKERKDSMLWKKVEELVQEDSRVDRYPKLVRGESKVVWEWQVEGSLSTAKIRKKEASKLKSSAGVEANTDQQHRAWKSEPKTLML